VTNAYEAPLRDIGLALDVVAPRSTTDSATMLDLLAEFGRFCSEVVAPLNRPGDEAGIRFDASTGNVVTAPGWKDAYRKYVDAGWGSVSFPADVGGGGLPWLLTTAMQEMLNASSMAFALAPMLTQGAVHMLYNHSSPDQRERYLPQLVSGSWTGTMNLTESGAGSDVGALVTRAVPAGDGTWRITGQKIFITYGEHDMTEQIVHLVLARIPGAPPGTKGISCFIVPKYLLRHDGSPGERNSVRCIGVEHKMGIHASPTCTLEFDDAVGELIGDANAGMQYMFTMMNNARLSVGVEGLGIASRAYQAALAHARGRVQGRVVGGADGAPIIDHPDVRRMLLHMRSHIEAMRLIAYLNATAIDEPDRQLADLLTPVTKAWCTDVGAEVARLATQVLGGMGYIRETGVEQHERDVRIAAIYEGTNGIQAIDLVLRKLGSEGAAIDDLLVAMATTAGELEGELSDLGRPLVDGVVALREATDRMRGMVARSPRDALAGASSYLQLFGAVLGGWLLARQAAIAQARLGSDPELVVKIVMARYYLHRVVPHAAGLVPAITAGAADLDAVPSDLL
jgi:alkylation response protein AidB-like acyl-CoA dehydrogenase